MLSFQNIAIAYHLKGGLVYLDLGSEITCTKSECQCSLPLRQQNLRAICLQTFSFKHNFVLVNRFVRNSVYFSPQNIFFITYSIDFFFLTGRIDEAMLDNIPGNHGNRMTLLGEINWIFTAVTDTIAWCSFPVDLFQKLFRQDLLVASLFRNYLLAERLMRAFGCHPRSWPKLAPTHDHPIW